MTTKPGRYYSGNYARVDNPLNSYTPDAGTGYGEHENLSQPPRENISYDEYDLPERTRRRSNPPRYENGRSRRYSERQRRSSHAAAAGLYDVGRPRRSSHPPRHKEPWSKRKKILVWGSVALVLIIVLAVGLGVGLRHSEKFDYTPLDVQVTNATAFDNGGASRDAANVNDGIGAGEDKYTYYSGAASNFPAKSAWVSFSNMWAGNMHTLQTSCGILKMGKDNSKSDIQSIYDAIQNRAAASLVDHRYILAIILQESHGCARDGATTSSGGVVNPGLMQSHNGSHYISGHANASIYAMVQDGTQGTAYGDGLVQNLDLYGNAYAASRGYNSGYIPKSGNLSEAAGATACYVSDVANRLTGWANATNECSDTGY